VEKNTRTAKKIISLFLNFKLLTTIMCSEIYVAKNIFKFMGIPHTKVRIKRDIPTCP
jgi:hypothetical protein